MNPGTLNAYIVLLTTAETIGAAVFKGVKALVKKALTPAENKLVLDVWNDNVRRSAINAGLPDPGPTPPGPTDPAA